MMIESLHSVDCCWAMIVLMVNCLEMLPLVHLIQVIMMVDTQVLHPDALDSALDKRSLLDCKRNDNTVQHLVANS